MPATTSQNVSAAARSPARVSTTDTVASMPVNTSSTTVRPVSPSTFQVTAMKTIAATSRHRAPRVSSTTGTDADGSRLGFGSG